MSQPKPRALRFVRALVSGAVGMRDGDQFVAVAADGHRVTLDAAEVVALQSLGVLDGNGMRCSARRCGARVAAAGDCRGRWVCGPAPAS